jgi:hypothetical protein
MPMIDIKPPEEELRIVFTEKQQRDFEELMKKQDALLVKQPSQKNVTPNEGVIVDELHQLNRTLKDILRELKKRKT